MKILGIETSCDETSASVIENKGEDLKILSNIVLSQINLHKKYGGVVPEVASRAHIEAIIPVIDEALNEAKIKLIDVDAIAVTVGPGLIGSLLVGVNTAKALAFILKKPLIPVNHLEGHIYANFIGQNPKFPVVVLIASGGHTILVHMEEHLDYKILGQTKDDAAGEAFDKVAKILNVGYPGGPIIEKLAQKGNPFAFDFPKAEMKEKTYRDLEGYLRKLPPNLDFSFSGLKTAVLYQSKIQKAKSRKFLEDIAASFQKVIIEVLVSKTIWAAERTKAKSILISGGVAANNNLRKNLKNECKKIGYEFFSPPKKLCTDNAAMIALAAYYKLKTKNIPKISLDPNLKLG